MSGLIRAELTKIRTLPATWIALALAMVAATGLGWLASAGTVRIGSSAVAELGTLRLVPAYLFAGVAVFAAGSEYLGGQVRVSLLAAPSRHQLFAAKLAACVAVSVAGAVVVILPGHLVQRAGGLSAYVTAYVLLGLVGHGLAVLTRTVVTPLAGLFVAGVLVAPTLSGPFPELVRHLPHDAALSLTGLTNDPAALSGPAGLLVLAGWAATSLLLAWSAFHRADA